MTRLIRRTGLLAAVLCLAGTVSAQGVRVKMAAWPEPVLLDSMRAETWIDGKPDAVYAAALKTFADLGIPTGNTDNKAGIIGSEKFERVHSLMGAPMSRSFSCGESATGPNADSFRLTIAIAVWIKPGEKAGTAFSTAVVASGADISGTYRNPRECGSLGRVEQKILEGVQKYAK
jgi:hypothetical protein